MHRWPPIGLLAMMALGWAVGHGSTPVDAWFSRTARGIVGPDPRWLLTFSSGWLLIAVAAICLVLTLCRRQWRLSVAVVVCPVVAVVITEGLKRLFERSNGSYLVYPSGHTTLLVAVLGMMVVVAAAERQRVLAAIATGVSLLGALGLVVCGYHYLTDTIGAALLATALVCLAAQLAGAPWPGSSSRLLGAALVVVGVTGRAVTGVGAASPDPGPGPSPDVPPVGTEAAAAGFVDVRSVVPNAIIDLRYATPNNFVGTPLYPPDARCLVHESLASGLAAAADMLRRGGRTLVFWDCYRPHDVQVKLFEAVLNPNWVARPGSFARSHEAGRSVDVTIAGPVTQCPATQWAGEACLVEMGTDFDDFSPRGLAFATEGISEPAAANRAVLRNAMSAGGLAAYSGEWWHFDGPGAGVERPILDVPVT
jgi:D-alanyl-D-alanine dipeptidase